MSLPISNFQPIIETPAPNSVPPESSSSSKDTHPKEANLISSGEFLLSVYADEILKIKNITNS
jgi:hypothetical protein